METPATGMWGPGDFPEDFITIDMLWSRDPQAVRRNEVVDTLIDLAHDLDARGLVLVEMAYGGGLTTASGLVPNPEPYQMFVPIASSSPNTGS